MRKRRITVRSLKERREIVKRYEKSGLAAKRFCQEEGIAVSSLLGWRKKFGESVGEGVKARFAEVSPVMLNQSCEVALHFPSGLVLRIGG
jgi:transposase-like protein